MKKLILLVLLFTNIVCFAQYPKTNIIKALVFYQKDNNGFYYKTEDTIISSLNYDFTYYEYGEDFYLNHSNFYAYDKKNKHLYIRTENSNYEITITKDLAKKIKHTNIPLLKKDALNVEILTVNNELKKIYDNLNSQRKQEIEDSIQIMKNIIEQKRLDSIEQAKEDSLTKERAKKIENEYRSTHDWHYVPTHNMDLNCSLCDYKIHTDSIYCMGLNINENIIYYLAKADSALGYYYLKLHKSYITNELKNNSAFQYHYNIFQDSLTHISYTPDSIDIEELNLRLLMRYINNLTKKAPYGYIDDWGWSNDYSMLTFDFSYFNTNRKTIKYIDVYFCVTNAVGDVRKTGHFKGTGPLGSLESANWSWDRSSYFVSGDASNMVLTKIILTYMDGTQKILPKKMIKYNYNRDY